MRTYDIVNAGARNRFLANGRIVSNSGRAVQIQNLPKNFLEPLSLARDIVKGCNVEGVKLIYGDIPNTLSQLIRTIFIPPKDKLLAVADFSAIEARIISWLAGEKWRMDVFATHGKIYEASASAMFNVPIETIVKDGANYDLRAKGKVAELACGYQGSVGALKAMGAEAMGLSDAQLQEIIDAWRAANPNIVKLWYGVQDAAINTIKTGRKHTFRGLVFAREMDFKEKMDYLTILLPSQRKLFYAFPKLGKNKWGGDSIEYMGMNQTNKKWERIETYGGKLTENVTQAIARDCLAHAIYRLRKVDKKVVMHIHDEVCLEIEKESELKEICDIMGRALDWAPGLILTASGFVNNYYKKE